MKVFVTGATGFIGEAVASAFSRAGHFVTGLIRKDRDIKRLQALEVAPLLGDLRRPETYHKAIDEADVLVHCAFELSPQGVELDKLLIDQFTKPFKTPKRVIYTSGCWVYGNTKNATETSPLHPIPLVTWRPSYEEIVLKARSSTLTPIVIRPGCVYGRSGSLTSLWFKSIAEGKPLIAGDGKNSWAMIHVDDLAELYLLAAEKEDAPSILNGADDSHITLKECMEGILNTVPTSNPITYLTDEESHKTYGKLAGGLLVDQHISNALAKQSLGWKPRHTSFLDYVKLHYDAWQALNS